MAWAKMRTTPSLSVVGAVDAHVEEELPGRVGADGASLAASIGLAAAAEAIAAHLLVAGTLGADSVAVLATLASGGLVLAGVGLGLLGAAVAGGNGLARVRLVVRAPGQSTGVDGAVAAEAVVGADVEGAGAGAGLLDNGLLLAAPGSLARVGSRGGSCRFRASGGSLSARAGDGSRRTRTGGGRSRRTRTGGGRSRRA